MSDEHLINLYDLIVKMDVNKVALNFSFNPIIKLFTHNEIP
jgi:hypothetical protein